MTKVVLVTGAMGYMGGYVVQALLDVGLSVVAVDRSEGRFDPRARYFRASFQEIEARVLPEIPLPDVCLHLAWTDGFQHASRAHIDNLPDHLNFLRGMAVAGIGQIAVIGTMHEVGYWEGVIDESTPTNPASLYGIAKNALRQALEIELAPTKTLFQWLRAFYIVGNFERGNSIFSKIVQWDKEGRKTFPFTTGKNKFDFISIEALSEQIAAVVAQEEVAGIIHCCSGEPVALKDKVEEIIRLNNLSIRPEFGAFPDRAYDSPAVWGNASKIREIMSKSATRS